MLDSMLLVYGLIAVGEFLLWRAIEAYGARGGGAGDIEALRGVLRETREAHWAIGESLERLREGQEFTRRLRRPPG